jgi:hypothetical protein
MLTLILLLTTILQPQTTELIEKEKNIDADHRPKPSKSKIVTVVYLSFSDLVQPL